MTPADLIAALEARKARFESGSAAETERLLAAAALPRTDDAALLARLHETLLFLRAYPASRAVAKLADAALAHFAVRVPAGAEALEEPEISGIDGTGLTAVFSYGVARHLVAAHPRQTAIAWDAWESPQRLGSTLRRRAPFSADQTRVEAHPDYRAWVACAAGKPERELPMLLDVLSPDEYEMLEIPLRVTCAGAMSRSKMRLPGRLFLHTEPLIRRQQVSLDVTTALPVRRLPVRDGARMLSLARTTSAVRYRELHGFTFGDAARVDRIEAGRGVVFFLNGVPPAARLPLRAYHSATIWKNGVPIGYFEGLSISERMEAGFNLYYTFREGETAWLYARLLQMFRQTLGVTVFLLDPYQIGHENEEAIASGAFWFYRKLGFRSTRPDLRALTAREEARIAARPGYRTPPAMLRRLVAAPMIYGFPGSRSEDWENFSANELALRLTRQPRLAKRLSLVLRLKQQPEEAAYLKATQAVRPRAQLLLSGADSQVRGRPGSGPGTY